MQHLKDNEVWTTWSPGLGMYYQSYVACMVSVYREVGCFGEEHFLMVYWPLYRLVMQALR